MKVQVIKGFATRDTTGRMIYPTIGDVIDLPASDAQRLAQRGSVLIIDEPEPPPTPVKRVPKKVI